MAHAGTAKIVLTRVDIWGQTYDATGPIVSPDGRNPMITAYWLIRHNDPRPQFTGLIPFKP